MSLKFRYLIVLISFLVLFSCDDTKTEEDKYPDIPEFPNFKNGDLKLVLKKEILAKIDSNVINEPEYYTRIRYIVKDSTFYLITYLANTYQPDMPEPGDRYSIHLYTFKNEKINHHHWIDNDFKINFEIDKSNNNLTIGKRKYFANSNYINYDILPKFIDSTRVDDVFYKGFGYDNYIWDSNFYNPKSFDKIVIDSKAVSTAKENSAISIFFWKYRPIYLTYYKVKYKNKVGLTKVTDFKMPVFIKCNDELYFLDLDYLKINSNTGIEKILIYKIE